MRWPVLILLAAMSAVPAAAEPAARLVAPAADRAENAALAAYGPFRVLDARTAAVVDVTDENTPAAFRAMLRDFPALSTLRFVDCPGTYDDGANLAVGRQIRAAGIATEVPADGSVRSGGVELFLAGVRRSIDDRAEFAVHAWEDEDGREATDFAADSPETAKYLAYYREMGLADPAGFYAMTNSVAFADALWLTGAQMRRWTGDSSGAAPQLAHIDLALSLP